MKGKKEMQKSLSTLLMLFSTIFAAEKSDNDYIFTEGTGKVVVKPNYVTAKLGVSIINTNPDSALVKTNGLIDTILFVLKSFNVKESDIETYSSAFVREYKDNRDTTTYLGIKSECILKIAYYDLPNFEKLLNTMISKGMNVIHSYEFKHTGEDSLKRIAAQKAFDEAKRNALAITDKSSRNLGKLLNISYEKPDDYRVRPDFKIELSRDLIGSLMLSKRGSLKLSEKQDLKYLRIIIPTIDFENTVYAKFGLK